jgi:hypothetical protein
VSQNFHCWLARLLFALICLAWQIPRAYRPLSAPSFPVPFGLPISFCCKSPISKLGYLAVVFHRFLVHLSLETGWQALGVPHTH